MKKTIIIIIILILICAVIIYFAGKGLTGETINNYRSYTTAICNEQNYCEDYEVICNGKELIRSTPTGFSVQHEENWTDPRGENNKISCE